MSKTSYERIIAALHAQGKTVKERGPEQATAQCPAHDDGSPSLSVTQGAENALIHCFAGCQTADIMAALNLDLRDLYDNPRGQTYSYVDRDGVIARTVTRKPKPAGKSDYFQAVHEKTVILYRLTEVDTAVKRGEVVYLVEGEKDADNAHAIAGVTATTSPQGASNFHHVDVTPLKGAHVVAIVDRDEAGDKWAQVVASQLEGVADSLTFKEATIGNDLSDHLAAGKSVNDLTPYRVPLTPSDDDTGTSEEGRHLVITSAADIRPRRVTWTWQDRIAQGTLSLLAGREGLGKSTLAVDVAAQVTRGTLPGSSQGKPRAVIYAATEDSWEHTIVPRLMGAGADLTRVYRVEVQAGAGFTTGLNLPRDIKALKDVVLERDVSLMILDPIMSRLDNLDTHKDAEVRQALEPLVRMADETGMAILGLIHLNKSSHDPLNAVMGSKAFTAVARSVLHVIPDADDETEQRRLFGVSKNNLARVIPSTTVFTVETAPLSVEGETITTGRISWHGDSTTSIKVAMSDTEGGHRTIVSECSDWLTDYLTINPGSPRAQVIRDGQKEGFNPTAINRASDRLKVVKQRAATEKATTSWSLPEHVTGDHSSHSSQPAYGETSIYEKSEISKHSQRKVPIQTNHLSHSSHSSHVSRTNEMSDEITASASPRCPACSRMMLTTPHGETHCTNKECAA